MDRRNNNDNGVNVSGLCNQSDKYTGKLLEFPDMIMDVNHRNTECLYLISYGQILIRKRNQAPDTAGSLFMNDAYDLMTL